MAWPQFEEREHQPYLFTDKWQHHIVRPWAVEYIGASIFGKISLPLRPLAATIYISVLWVIQSAPLQTPPNFIPVRLQPSRSESSSSDQEVYEAAQVQLWGHSFLSIILTNLKIQKLVDTLSVPHTQPTVLGKTLCNCCRHFSKEEGKVPVVRCNSAVKLGCRQFLHKGFVPWVCLPSRSSFL